MDNQEKFLKYTTEILTSTMNELHMQVIQYKANARVLEEMIIDQNQKLVEFDKALVEERKQRVDLESKYVKLAVQEEEFVTTKHQLNHLETFKRELSASRTDADNQRSLLSMTHAKYEDALREIETLNSDQRELKESLRVAIEEQEKLKEKIVQLTPMDPPAIEPEPEAIVKIKPVKLKVKPAKDGNDF